MERVPRLLGAGLLAYCCVHAALAIDPARSLSQYVHEKWGPESGFPSGPVYAINQSRDGYLWIGTETGLIRFDGLNFTPLEQSVAEAPSVRHALGIVTDGEGRLFVRLLRPSVLEYRDGVFDNLLREPGHVLVAPTAIARARDGSLLLWILGDEPKVWRVHQNQWRVVAAPDQFTRSPVLAMTQTSDGAIWVGTRDAGLFRGEGNHFQPITEGLPDRKVNALATTADGQVWVGTDAGVVRWDGQKLTHAGVPPSLNGEQALAMIVDGDANLWVGTNSGRLYRVNSRGSATLSQPAGQHSHAITTLFEDREGNLWIGRAGELERLRDSAMVSYSQPEGLPTEGATPVFVDSENRVWFGPRDGGLRWFKDGFHGEVAADGLAADVVYSIAGRKGELWVGRQNGGLTRLRWEGSGIGLRNYTHKDGLAQDSVYSVFLASDGAVWAGTVSGGVTRLQDGRLTTYTSANGLASNTVAAMAETPDGTMWFATPAGMSALSQTRWRAYTVADGLPANDINCLLTDSAGVVWAGTSTGVAQFSAGRFQTPPGMPPSLRERILGMAEDGYGSLWISASRTVARISRAGLLRGLLPAGTVREYGIADGLRGVEGVKRSRSVVADDQGRVWFAVNRGIAVVDPRRLRISSVPALAHIRTLQADGSPVSLTGPVHVPGGRQRITFGFDGLSLSVPSRVRFRYQLEDFDRNWTEPVAGREAVYTNLPPGRYRFRVVASNPDGVWNDREAVLAFTLDPLFWQTWWFRAAVCVAFGLLSIGLYRLRLKQMAARLNLRFAERLAERTRIARELHDTLLQGFMSASMQLHVACDQMQGESPAKASLERALQLMTQVIDEGRNAVRGLRSSQSSSLDLEHAFARVPEELAQAEMDQTIPAFRVVVEGQPRPLHPLLRDEAYRIGREALINAFRHARARNIEIELSYSPSHLRLLVRDDGCGMTPQLLQSGREGHWGLSGMRERAERIGAQFQVWSRAAAGTEIELTVPGRIAFQDHHAGLRRWIENYTPGWFRGRQPGASNGTNFGADS